MCCPRRKTEPEENQKVDHKNKSRMGHKNGPPQLENRNHMEHDDRRFPRDSTQFPLHKKRNDINKKISREIQ